MEISKKNLEVFGTGIIQFLSISDIFSVFCVFLFQLFDIIKQIFLTWISAWQRLLREWCI